jgi:hypothetical protein
MLTVPKALVPAPDFMCAYCTMRQQASLQMPLSLKGLDMCAYSPAVSDLHCHKARFAAVVFQNPSIFLSGIGACLVTLPRSRLAVADCCAKKASTDVLAFTYIYFTLPLS